jgi:polysaccharide pyruvyl transferase WcaK-like protein
MRILVIGFYNCKNIGDDLFEELLPPLLQKWGHFVKCQGPNVHFNAKEWDCILFGGGDTLNAFFVEPVSETLRSQLGDNVLNWPVIYGIGVGCPYISYMNTGALDIFSSISVRNNKDAYDLKKHFGDEYITSSADIACLLGMSEMNPPQSRNIGVILARPIHETKPYLLDEILIMIESFREHYDIITLIDFNRDTKSKTECDFYTHRDLAERIKTHIGCDVHHIHNIQSINEVMNVFSGLDFILGMRFHSILLSAIANRPVVPLAFSPKMIKLVETLGLSSSCSLSAALDNTKRIREYLCEGRGTLLEHLKHVTSTLPRRLTSPQWSYINWNSEIDRALYTYKCIIGLAKTPEDQAAAICYSATSCFSTVYEYGVLEKIRNGIVNPFDARDDIVWILKDFIGKRIEQNLSFRGVTFVRDYISADNHVNGWAWCVRGLQDHIIKMDRLDKCNIIIDDYLDATFGWESSIRSIVGKLPYKNNWLGFLHHTFEKSVKNNAEQVLNNPLFKESLPYCRVIFVFSENFALQLQTLLPEVNIQVITHPKEMNGATWSLEKFQKNPRIVQIGGFMRDPLGIYKLALNNKQSSWISKCILNGPQMSSYRRPQDLQVVISGKKNVFHREFQTWVNEKLSEVEEISELTKDDYIELLECVVVMLPLIDVSACNTLLECIVMKTPVIVPDLDALRSVLPSDYPLFYPRNDYVEAGKCVDTSQIITASKILNQNNQDYSLFSFCENICSIIN